MEPLHHVSGNWVAGGGAQVPVIHLEGYYHCATHKLGGEHMISGAGGGSKGRFLEF